MKNIFTFFACLFCFVIATVKAQSPSWEWTITEGGNTFDGAEAVQISNDGYIYITGSFAGVANFSGDTITQGNASAYLAKYRPDSTMVWVKTYGDDFFPYSFAIGANGTIYVTGTKSASATLVIAKYDSLMNLQWIKESDAGYYGQSGTYPTNYGYDLTLDNMDNVIVTGVYQDSLAFGSTAIYRADEFTTGSFLVKLTSTGNLVWLKDGASDDSEGMAVAVDASNNVYWTGNSYSGSTEVGFFNKYDATGTALWSKQVDDYEAIDIATDRAGNVYTGGYVNDTTIFGTTQVTPVAFNRAVVTKIDAASGNYLWVKSFGTSANGSTTVTAIQADSSGVVYVAGSYSQQIILDSTYNATTSNGFDSYLTRLDNAGDVVWGLNSSPLGFLKIRDIEVAANEDLYVAGTAYNTSLSSEVLLGKLRQSVVTATKENIEGLVAMYPNPSTDHITLRLDGITSCDVKIYDLLGELVYSQNINTTTDIETSSLSNGTYLVMIRTGEKLQSRKLVVQ
jgi:hypothetical protein